MLRVYGMNINFKILLGIIVIGVIAYFGGYKSACNDYEVRMDNRYESYQSFYATITDISNDKITVEGMKVNDINFQGKFIFEVEEVSRIEWRHMELESSELEVGDNISILFKGVILESNPAWISDVLKIQLLDDSSEM